MTISTVPAPPPPGRDVSALKPSLWRSWGMVLIVVSAGVLLYACSNDAGQEAVTNDVEVDPVEDEPEPPSEPEPTAEPQATDDVEPGETAEPESRRRHVEAAAYEVVSVEDTGLGRIDAHVIVAGQPDQDTLIATAEAAVLNLRTDSPYTGAFVFFYAEHDPTDDTYTLARAIDAPGGDIANAEDARSGEYSEHIIVIDAREKDWAEQPSAQDTSIYTDWIALNDELWDEVEFEELDAETDRRLAERLGMQPEEVAAAVNRVSSWSFSGEQITVQLGP